MNHLILKSNIRVAQATARMQRTESHKLLHRGRKLRKQSQGHVSMDPLHREQYQAEGQECRRSGLYLRNQAEYNRDYRRTMHLAAALLNGKTYEQCEQKCNPKNPPDAAAIGGFIRAYLPPGEREHSEYIAQRWVLGWTMADIRTQGLAPLAEKAKRKAEMAKQKASMAKLQSSIKSVQTDYEHYSSQVISAEQTVQRYKQNVKDKASVLARLQDELAAMEQVLQKMTATPEPALSQEVAA